MQVTPDDGRYVCRGRRRLVLPEEADPVSMPCLAPPSSAACSRIRGHKILTFAGYKAPRSVKNWSERYGDPRDPKVDGRWVGRSLSPKSDYGAIMENMQVTARIRRRDKLQSKPTCIAAPARIAKI